MTKLGAAILLLIALAGIAFVSMLSFGPAPVTARPTIAATIAPDKGDGKAAASEQELTVPVTGVSRAALRDTWDQSREGGTRGHHGTDIMAAAGTPVIAAGDGWVEKLFESGRGGTTVYQRSADRRLVYYYAHLAGYAPGLHEGLRVRAGQLLGFVGDSGDAGAGNYHLHFGVTRMRAGERWWQGENVNPYPLLARPGAKR